MSERLSNEEVKELNQQRAADASRERAEAYAEQVKAAREHGFYVFTAKHCGYQAVARNDVYWGCTANDLLMSSYILAQGLPINEQSLESAFHVLRAKGVLADAPTEPYTRKTDGTMFVPQNRHTNYATSVVEPKRLIGVSRAELCKWSAAKIKEQIKKGFGPEIDRILQGRE